MEKEAPLFASLFGLTEKNIFVDQEIWIEEPLSTDRHNRILLSVAGEYNDALTPKLAAQLTVPAVNGRFLDAVVIQDYKAYLLSRNHVGVVVGTVNAFSADGSVSRQKIYVNRLSIRTDNTQEVIEGVLKKYSKFGAVYPKGSMFYSEIRARLPDMPDWKFDEGMDIANDIGLLERLNNPQERIVNGEKLLVTSYRVPNDVAPSIHLFSDLVTKKLPVDDYVPRCGVYFKKPASALTSS